MDNERRSGVGNEGIVVIKSQLTDYVAGRFFTSASETWREP